MSQTTPGLTNGLQASRLGGIRLCRLQPAILSLLHLLHLARLPHLDDAPWLNLEADNPVTLIGVTCTSSKQWQDLGVATVRKPEARMVLEIQLQVVVEVVPERVTHSDGKRLPVLCTTNLLIGTRLSRFLQVTSFLTSCRWQR